MLTEKTEIGSGLLFCLIFALLFGYGLPKAAFLEAKYLGPNGYWSIAAAFLLALPVILIIVGLGRRYPGHSLIDLLPLIFGRPVGLLLGLLYVGFFLGLMVWEIKALAHTFHIYFLIRTPLGVISTLLLLSTLYIASKGVEGVTRLAAFLFFLPLYSILLTLFAAYQGIDPDNLRPVFFFTGPQLIRGTFHLFNPFLPLATLFAVYRYYSRKAQGFKVIIAATGLAMILILAATVATIGVYGAKKVTVMTWAFMELTKQSDIPVLFQTTGLFFGSVYLIEVMLSLSAIYFAAADTCARLTRRLTYKWFLLILFPLILWAAFSLKSELETELFFDYLRIAGLLMLLPVPVAVWIMTVLLRKRLP